MPASLLQVGKHLLKWTAIFLVAAAVLVPLGAWTLTWWMRREETDPTPDTQKLARTLEIIRTSTPEHRKALKVLFYGQSITRSGWEAAVVDHWRQKYPNTVFVVENMAIGGFSSDALASTAARDVSEFYPDLIVFHVYGGHHDYEKILRDFRSLTAADVILQTDHGATLPDPPCREGLRLSRAAQPGCTPGLWQHQQVWEDEMSYHKIPALARKYGLAVEPQRAWWRDYLLRTHLRPESLLVDEVHPNAAGKALMAEFFDRYFDAQVAAWQAQQTSRSVVSLTPPAGQDGLAAQPWSFRFTGVRAELLTGQPLAAAPAVILDGKPSRDLDGCYQATRVSPFSNVPEWPALRRVELRHERTVEDWTATLTEITPAQDQFRFTLRGSVSGDQGGGDAYKDFVSRDGKIAIVAFDWMVGRNFDYRHVPLHAPVDVHFSVRYVCGDAPEVIDMGGGRKQYRYVLATGLENRRHTVRIAPLGREAAEVTEVRAYRPPLRSPQPVFSIFATEIGTP